MNGEAATQAAAEAAGQLRSATAEPVRPEPIDLAQRRAQRAVQQARSEPATEPVANEPQLETSREKTGENALQREGSSEKKVALESSLSSRVADRIIQRQKDAERMQKEGTTLGVLDRLMLNLGHDLANRIRAGELTEEDLAVILSEHRDELYQVSGVAGVMIADKRITSESRAVNIPILRGLFGTTTTSQFQSHAESIPLRFSTDYTRTARFNTLTPKDLEEYLLRLNSDRLALEEAFFGKKTTDPLFDKASTPLYPQSVTNGLGNLYQDELGRRLDSFLQEKYSGKTFDQLQKEDPLAALAALVEANQQAAVTFGDEAAKSLIKSERPEIDVRKIEDLAKKAEETPTPEEVQKLESAAGRAKTEFETAETTFKNLKTDTDLADKDLADKSRALETAENTYSDEYNERHPEIERLRTRAEQLYNSILPPTVTLTKDEAAAYQQNVAKTSEQAARLEATAKAHEDRLLDLMERRRKAEEEKNKAQETVDKLENDTELQEKITKAQEEYDQKKTVKNDAEKAYKEKKQQADEVETKGISQENKDKASALRKWAHVKDDLGTVIDTVFSSSNPEDKYYIAQLFDTNEQNGQVLGTERIREILFSLIHREGQPYDEKAQALARKMLSDETIVRSIIRVYKLDVDKPDVGGVTFSDLFDTIRQRRSDLQAIPARNTQQRETLQNEIRAWEKTLVRKALNQAGGWRFEAADLVRFIANEGLKSAEDGNPYLELSPDALEFEVPEFRTEAENIWQNSSGNAQIDTQQRRVTWDAEVTDYHAAQISPNLRDDQPLHIRVTHTFNRDAVGVAMEAATDQRFFASLPERFDPQAIPENWRPFYDGAGNRRIAPRGLRETFLRRTDIPDWVPIGDEGYTFRDGPTANAIDQGLGELDNRLAPDISKKITAAVTETTLKMPESQRKEVLRGFLPKQVVGVASTEDGTLRNYIINVDNNGRMLIRETLAGTQDVELTAFYENRLKAFKQALGVITLTPIQVNSLRNEFLQIQAEVGKEILRAQQRR